MNKKARFKHRKYSKKRNNSIQPPPVASSPFIPIAAGLLGVFLVQQNVLGEEQTQSIVTLPTITVQEQYSHEINAGYQATQTRVGKVLQDPHAIPQAVTTVTHQLMEDQQVGSLKEALRNVSGLTFNAAEGGRSGDNMMLRGFYTFGDMYLDGIRDTAQYNRETFYLEQVDILRGAAAMLFGRGQAGGVINQVSKIPLFKNQHILTSSIGNEGYHELTGDLNQRLAENIAVRVNLMERKEGSWRSNPATGISPQLQRQGIATSIRMKAQDNDEMVLNHLYTTTDDRPDYGISFDPSTRRPNTLLPNQYYWGISNNFDKSQTTISTVSYAHPFATQSEWRTQIRYADYERSYWVKTPNLTSPQNAQGTIGGNPTRMMDYETLTFQSDLNHIFDIGSTQHKFLAGVEYLKEDSLRTTLQNFGGTTVNNPPNYQPYLASRIGTPVKFKSNSYAAYLQDTVEFIPQWKFTLGTRRDILNAHYSSSTSPNLSYHQWSVRSALSWHPAEDTHYYISASNSFSPTADLYQLTVNPLPPERSNVFEIGAKWLLLEGDLATRIAFYRADKEWERNTDLESTAAVLTKKRRTDGFEVELAGRITPKWQVFSGLALMNSKILQVAENVNPTTGVITYANPGYQGQRSRNTPPYTFNIWAQYALTGNWKIAGGVESKGERYGYNPSGSGAIPTLPGETGFSPNTAPAYARWDFMLAYEQKDWLIRLNIKNVFNKLYYDAIYDNGGFTVPGIKRTTMLTAEIKI